MPVSEEVVFHNGTVFDGRAFLPTGTCVWVADGRVTGVGPGPAGRIGKAEPIDLADGTLLPGFIDAHAHPVFAGDQMRRCDLRAASTAAGYIELVAAYAAEHPDEEWISGGGWAMDAFPGGIPTRQALDAVVPDRPVFLPNRDGHGAWVNSRALALAGIDRSTPDPTDGRIERDAAGEPVGMLQEGAAVLVSRLLPEVTEDDWYNALLTAQDCLLSLGITGWQDAIVGRYEGEADPLTAYLRAAKAGTLLASVTGALWWDRHRGLEQLGELLEQRSTGQAGTFRAASVKMMLDGVAENHTAAMLEPYQDAEGCPTAHSGLDFIDPASFHALSPRWTKRDSRFISMPSATAPSAMPWMRWRPLGSPPAAAGSGITWRTFRWCIQTTSRASPASRQRPTSSLSGRPTSRRWMSSPSRSSASAGRNGSTPSGRCSTAGHHCARAATGR